LSILFSGIITSHPDIEYQWVAEFGVILNYHKFARKRATSIQRQYPNSIPRLVRHSLGDGGCAFPCRHPALLRKFTELAFDEASEMRWQESRPMEADNIDVGPPTETDLHSDLIDSSGNPF